MSKDKCKLGLSKDKLLGRGTNSSFLNLDVVKVSDADDHFLVV